ncbi:MAG: hypothetical protein WEC83_01000 [Patescibacteria group bacterium]
MSLLVFWLTPVVLVLVLALLLLRYQPKHKPKLILVEPLLLLVNQWHVSRIVGAEPSVRRQLALWQEGLELKESVVEQLVRQVIVQPGAKATRAIIIEQRRLPFWAEQRIVETLGKRSAVLCGPVSELLDYCNADNSGELTQEKRQEWLDLAATAARNGFLALGFAETAGKPELAEKAYQFSGITVLEPVFNKEMLQRVRSLAAQGQLRFLSFLPIALLENIREKALPAHASASTVSGQELQEMLPKEQEAAIERSVIYGEIPTRSRYWIARQLQRRYQLIVVSHLSQDNDIPADDLV